LVPALGGCVWWLSLVPVLGACPWCLSLVPVLGACPWWLCVVAVLGGCPWCLFLVAVLGACVWWSSLRVVLGGCPWWLSLIGKIPKCILELSQFMLRRTTLGGRASPSATTSCFAKRNTISVWRGEGVQRCLSLVAVCVCVWMHRKGRVVAAFAGVRQLPKCCLTSFQGRSVMKRPRLNDTRCRHQLDLTFHYRH
jgi:hypothetical protein